MFECRAAIEADAGDASNLEFDDQYISLLARRVVTRRAMDGPTVLSGKVSAQKRAAASAFLSYQTQIVFFVITCPSDGIPTPGLARYLNSPMRHGAARDPFFCGATPHQECEAAI